MKIRIFFAWYDMWIGAYWSKKERALYICLLPMIVVEIAFGRKRSLWEKNITDLYETVTPSESNYHDFVTIVGGALWTCILCGYTVPRNFMSSVKPVFRGCIPEARKEYQKIIAGKG
jgi:hypothetical protein